MIAFLIFFLCSLSCEVKAYIIAQDPSWNSIDLFNKEINISAYASAIFVQIQESEDIPMTLISVDSITLLSGLDQNLYDGALSNLSPLLTTESKYDFSPPFLLLGPVLITRMNSREESLEEMSGRRVGVYAIDSSIFIAQRYPALFIQKFTSIPDALAALATGNIDALLIPILAAQKFIPALYPNTLKIASKPLNDEGLRLLTLRGQAPNLQNIFSRNLRAMRRNGTLKRLQKEFNVN